MNIGDIIGDALAYPFHNVKALVLYIVLGIIAAIIGGTTILSFVTAASTKGLSSYALGGVGILGILIFIILLFLIEGYALDIIKFGIERRADGPGIDIGRQVSNAIKLLAVNIAYYLIPAIIIFVLGLFLRDWILTIISIILLIVFALANFMARCRLIVIMILVGIIGSINDLVGDILFGIALVYLIFFYHRAIGLLYSNV